MKKVFNSRTPMQFMTYMSRLEDKRRTVVTGKDDYILQNADLIRKYKKSRSKFVRERIKESLFWINIKFLHKIFMTKLHPNLFGSDVLDIYQELCVSLINGIDVAFKRKDINTDILSSYIKGYLMGGVDRIIKEYYKPSEYFEFLEDPDSLEFVYPDHPEIITDIAYRYLRERERAIIDEYYFKDNDYEEISERFGLTKQRISQIKLKSLKKIREALEESNSSLNLNIIFRKDIFKIIRQYPMVRWVVFDSPYQYTVRLRELEKYGINPRQFLIISEQEPSPKGDYYNRRKYEYHIPNQYYGNIYDRSLVAVSEAEIEYPFKYDIFREIEGLDDKTQCLLSEQEKRGIAINRIYKRELRQ